MSVQADPSNQADPPAPGVEIALDSLRLRVGDHVGVFYRGMEECQAVVLPLIDEALAAGCGVIYVSDHDTPKRSVASCWQKRSTRTPPRPAAS